MKYIKYFLLLFFGLFLLSACGSNYTITFVTNSDEEVEPIVYKKGEELNLPTLTKEGYDFKGWFLDSEFKEEFTDQEITKDITLYAKWEIKKFTVKFMDSTTEIASVTVEYGKAATAPTPPEKVGYTFKGWDKDFSNVKQNLFVYAQYDNLTFEVVFMDGDQQIGDKQIITYGNAATAPTTPTKEGYTFKGWDKEFSNVTSDLVVNAVWELKKFTVFFMDKYNLVIKEEIVEYGNAATAPADPSQLGYTFKGWDKDFSNVTSDMTVNAVYEAINYTITYYDGDTVLDLEPATYTVEQDITYPTYNKQGYLFIGWYTASDFAGDPVTGFSKGKTGNVVLYAKTLDASQKFALNYELNGGMWGWTVNTVSEPAKGISKDSTLPVIFMQDFYTYLKNNNLLNSDVVAVSLRVSTWADFSKLTGDPLAHYNKTTTNTAQSYDGYSQLFVNGGSGNATTGEIYEIVGGFFGAEGYKEKYTTLAQHLAYMLVKRYTNWNTFWTNQQSESLTGFVLDGYFYGTQGLSNQDAQFVALRGVIPTPDTGYRYVNGKLETYSVDYLKTEMVFGTSVVLPIPSRVGYFFAGWYDNPQFNGNPITKINEGETPAAKYYAKWISVNE